MSGDDFVAAMLELCDDIADLNCPHIWPSEYVERMREEAQVKAQRPAKDLLRECLIRQDERQAQIERLYRELIDSGEFRREELHEEALPVEGMDPELWRMQYLEDRIHRYGLALLWLQRVKENGEVPGGPLVEGNTRSCAERALGV